MRPLHSEIVRLQSMDLPDSHKSFRPLSVLSLRLNFLAHGLRVEGYHLVNILIHAVTTAQVVILAHSLASTDVRTGAAFYISPYHCRWSRDSDQNSEEIRERAEYVRATSLFAGLLFAAHSVHAEPVLAFFTFTLVCTGRGIPADHLTRLHVYFSRRCRLLAWWGELMFFLVCCR